MAVAPRPRRRAGNASGASSPSRRWSHRAAAVRRCASTGSGAMARALLLACAVWLIGLGGTAWAKPRIAVLGLEVAPGPNGVVDPVMTQLAKEITRDLRQRTQSGASRYSLAPNSNKELTDEKLLMSC